MGTLFGKDQGSQVAMAVATGKWVNDLGQIDMCNDNPGTIYAAISFVPAPIYLGTCIPTQCNSNNVKVIEDALSNLAAQMGIPLRGQINFPVREQPMAPDTIRVTGFLFFGVLFFT